jgi:hypothetical protein
VLLLTRSAFVLARWGGLGNHRYQVGFSGDVQDLTWKSLAFQPYYSFTARCGARMVRLLVFCFVLYLSVCRWSVVRLFVFSFVSPDIRAVSLILRFRFNLDRSHVLATWAMGSGRTTWSVAGTTTNCTPDGMKELECFVSFGYSIFSFCWV